MSIWITSNHFFWKLCRAYSLSSLSYRLLVFINYTPIILSLHCRRLFVETCRGAQHTMTTTCKVIYWLMWTAAYCQPYIHHNACLINFVVYFNDIYTLHIHMWLYSLVDILINVLPTVYFVRCRKCCLSHILYYYYHRLCGSASTACVNGDRPSQWEMANFDSV